MRTQKNHLNEMLLSTKKHMFKFKDKKIIAILDSQRLLAWMYDEYLNQPLIYGCVLTKDDCDIGRYKI